MTPAAPRARNSRGLPRTGPGLRVPDRGPLTPAQSRLAEEFYPRALQIAAPYQRRYRRSADEFASAAAGATVGAAQRYEPRAGVDFTGYAMTCVMGAMLSVVRGFLPLGLRRHPTALSVENRGDVFDCEDVRPLPGRPAWDHADDSLDRDDYLEALFAPLPWKQRAMVQAIYLEGLGVGEAGERVAGSETYGRKLHGTAIRRLREILIKENDR